MKNTLLAAIALCLYVIPPPALPAPKAQSAQECATLADLALVAGAAAAAGVERAKTQAMLPRIYDLSKEDFRTLMRLIVGVAYGSARNVEPEVFAGTLGSACMRSEGNMDSILGAGV